MLSVQGKCRALGSHSTDWMRGLAMGPLAYPIAPCLTCNPPTDRTPMVGTSIWKTVAFLIVLIALLLLLAKGLRGMPDSAARRWNRRRLFPGSIDNLGVYVGALN